MRRHIITGAVLLFLIGFFFINSGQAGCAPVPPYTGVIEITGDAANPNHRDAHVYGFGKKAETGSNAKAYIPVSWYSFLEGAEPEGVVTILSTNNISIHYHGPYKLKNEYICEIDVQARTYSLRPMFP